MARRDVELVIRAKDEAEKVVKSITAAINDFTEAQANLDTKAGKTESRMQALGAAFGQLQKDLKGSSAADALSGALDKANNAAERLEAQVKETRSEVSRMDADFKSSSAGVEGLRARLTTANKALEIGQQRLKGYQTALSSSEKEMRDLAAAEKALKIGGLETQLQKKMQAAQKTEQRLAQLREEMAGMEKPTKRLSTSLETNTRRLAEQQTRVAELTGALSEARTRQGQIADAMRQTGESIREINTQIATQEGAVNKLQDNYSRLATETKEAETANNKLGTTLAKTNGVLKRQEDQLASAQNELVQLAATSQQAEATMRQLGDLSIKGLEDDLARQRRAMLEAKREAVEFAQRANELAAEIGRVGVPTREMAMDFERVKAQSAGAKQELTQQRTTLELMGRAFREAGTDMESLTAAQAKFVQLQGQAGQSILEIRSNTEAAVAAVNKLDAAYDRAADAANKTAQAGRNAANSTQRELTVSEQLARAYRNIYGEKRKALSLTQRLRGEVLSLVAAYGGLYGVIEILRRVVDAYQTVEAAQARLNVAFDGDLGEVSTEMDYLRRNAERLGIEFGALSTEYSKFAIATKNTALEGEAARKLFMQIAEAARVNRSSMDEMRGVFTAVTQIVNKGAVQMEELRQQLGDRLPGAIQLMADGLGVTTAELVKMMEQGEVTAEALIPFGNELEKRFGPQLAESLTQTSAEMGRLQNAAFQALRTFGEAGFMESFTELLRSLTETLQSAEGLSFIERLSQGFATLIDVVGLVVENFDTLVVILTTLVGIKLVPFAVAAVSAFTRLRTAIVGSIGAMAAFRGGLAATTTSMGAAAGATRGLTAAVRVLMGSTGIGLLVVGASFLFGNWITSANDATEAMVEHRDILDQVRNAYDLAGDSVQSWREALVDLSVAELKENVRRIGEAVEEAENAADLLAEGNDSFWTNFFGYNLRAGDEIYNVSDQVKSAVGNMLEAFKDGRVEGDQFIDMLDSTLSELDDGSDEFTKYANAVIKSAKNLVEMKTAQEEANAALVVKTGTTEEAAAAMEELAGREEEVVASAADAAAAHERFNGAMEELNKHLPEMTAGMSEFDVEAAKIAGSLDAALKAARALPDAIMRIAAEQEALAAGNAALAASAQSYVDSNFGSYSDGTTASAALLRQFEGFRATPYWDVNAYRVGYGSDTITLADGSVQQVVEGMRVSVEDANRDLIRRIETEFMPNAIRAVGEDRWGTFNPQEQAALTSIAYNYGSIPDRIVDALRNGTDEQIAEAIRGLGGDNDGVNRNRRYQEAAMFTSGRADETAARNQEREAERLADEAERRAEAAADFHESTNASIEQQQFELSIQDQNLVRREQMKAIREAELAAEKAGTELTEQQRQAILANVEAKYREQMAEQMNADASDRRAQAEERVNMLLEYRKNLQDALNAAVDEGDTAKADMLRAKIEEVNGQLEQAIANAKQMWAEVGGVQGDAAIAKLDAMGREANEFAQSGQKAYFSWDRVGDLIVNGLTSAFMQFAEAVANGENVAKAAREAFLKFASDFLIQIAQMIIKQAIFNALQAVTGGVGGVAGGLFGAGHTGGMVGSSRVGSGNQSRRVSPGVFAGAMRYHVGGLAGLRPGEVPIIAKQNEEILTRDDPRHMLNGGMSGGGGATTVQPKIINAVDGSDAMEQALADTRGQKAFINYIRANRATVKAALG